MAGTDRRTHMALASALATTEAPEATVTAVADVLGNEANGEFDRDLFTNIAGDKNLAAALQTIADREAAEKAKRAEKRQAQKARKAAKAAAPKPAPAPKK